MGAYRRAKRVGQGDNLFRCRTWAWTSGLANPTFFLLFGAIKVRGCKWTRLACERLLPPYAKLYQVREMRRRYSRGGCE